MHTDKQECVFTLYEVISYSKMVEFLEQNFRVLLKDTRFTWTDGVNRDYHIFSVYLDDGNILIFRSKEAHAWFSFEVITKDRILKYEV